MTMKSMKYQECDMDVSIMDNYNPVPPPLPRRVPPIRNIYAEPFETNTSRYVYKQELKSLLCRKTIIHMHH